MASEHRFGAQWEHYSIIDPAHEAQFKNWISLLGPTDFQGAAVLDAGCGMGRNAYWALRWGARELVAFDFDARSVSATRHNLKEFPNVKVEFVSLYNTPWQNQFDIVFSIGVIHHLRDPKMALANLVKALKPGGKLAIWVYSYEGNEWIPRFVDPVRTYITSKLPVSVVYWLSFFCSIPLWLMAKMLNGPTPYLRELAGFQFWRVHNIVLDQLIPEIAHYWTKEEVQTLFKELPVTVSVHRPPNQNGWTAIGIKHGA